MKILWIHNWPDARRSMGPFMWNVLDGLRKLNVNVDLYYFSIKPKNNPSVLGNYLKLRQIAQNYDVIHAQYGSMTGYVASTLGKKTLLTLRGSDWHKYNGPASMEYFHARVAHFLTKIAIPKCEHVMVMSQRMAEEISHICSSIIVAPDPIDANLFQPMNRDECRKKLGQGNDSRPWVLFNTLDRNNPIKRLELAEAAISVARRKIPDIQLKIATGIPYAEMPVFINSCNLALCTSTHEGWPNSIKEALACNIPFVATDVSDLKSFSLTEPSCKVVDADAASLGGAIVEVLTYRQPVNVKYLASHFSQDLISKKYLDLYKKCVE